MPHAARERISVRVSGVVQGVGFRPFVYRLANEENLAGFIGNDTDGVTIEIEGAPAHMSRPFSTRLTSETPPLARIDSVARRRLASHRRNRLSHRRQRSARPGQHRHPRRCRHLRRLPARVARSLGPPLPLSFLELHQLRTAIHHHAPHSLRPPADLDGEVPHVPRVPGRI